MDWINNGQSIKIPVGSYKILFTDLEGYQTPTNVVVIVNKNQTTNVDVEYLPIQTTIVVGVQDIGTRSINGAGLRWVTPSGDSLVERTDLDTSYFDIHPSFQFTDDIYNDNYFVKIPIAYWWRGIMPDTTDGTTPRWTMLISNTPTTWNGKEFTAQSAAFKHYQIGWMNQFYYGKYRGSIGYGSKPGATLLDNVSWNDWVSGCDALGNGHHLASYQEYCEIVGRMVIEKKTFQLFPDDIRNNSLLCKYRGIEDFGYGNTPVRYELLNGLRTNSNNIVTLWQEAGSDYVTTEQTIGSDDWIHSLLDGDLFDYLFLAKTVGNEETSFISDYSYSDSNNIGILGFHPADSSCGAFYTDLSNSPSDTYNELGGRLAKW